jgi:SAM-dependent methyltransferase
MSNPISIANPINPSLSFSSKMIKHRDYIYEAIKSNYLKFKFSQCFCGSVEGEIIHNYDAWGLNIPTIVCDNCYSIRSKYFFDDVSIKKFYIEGYYYPHMFTSASAKDIGMELDEYYQEEVIKGKDIVKYIKSNINLNEIKNVIEIGCGAGGILSHFEKLNLKVFGCDWGKSLIKIAQKNIPEGHFEIGDINKFKKSKFDLVILSDVVEHLTDPNRFFKELSPYLNMGKYIYINVPGFFGIGLNRWNCNIRQYFKIEHTFCHNLYSLNTLMKINGYDPVCGNEYVRAIYNKTEKKKKKIDKTIKNKIKWFLLITKIKNFIFVKTKINYFIIKARLLLGILKRKIIK